MHHTSSIEQFVAIIIPEDTSKSNLFISFHFCWYTYWW